MRHAHPETIVDADGIADPALSELGRWQAERLCAWLAHEPIDHIITSPKRRARDTVAALASRLSLQPEVQPDLDEIDRRSNTYWPTELLPTNGGEYFAKIRAQQWADIGWDTPEEFASRVLAVMEGIVVRRPGRCVLVSCHGGVMNRWIAHLWGVTARGSFNIPYASITRVKVLDEREPLVTSLNETGHFDAEREELRGPMRDGSPYRGTHNWGPTS